MRDKKERKAKERNGMIMLERRRVRLETGKREKLQKEVLEVSLLKMLA
jgi:septum formation topological specificity factor MinE